MTSCAPWEENGHESYLNNMVPLTTRGGCGYNSSTYAYGKVKTDYTKIRSTVFLTVKHSFFFPVLPKTTPKSY